MAQRSMLSAHHRIGAGVTALTALAVCWLGTAVSRVAPRPSASQPVRAAHRDSPMSWARSIASQKAVLGEAGTSTGKSPGSAAAAAGISASRVLPGVPMPPHSLGFVQDGLHNCGCVAMLQSWARLHPGLAAQLVRRLTDGSYEVEFGGAGPVDVSPQDLAEARKIGIASGPGGDLWGPVVLTAFTRLKSGDGPLDFHGTEWIYAGEMGSCLTGFNCDVFDIRSEEKDAKGRTCLSPPASLTHLDAVLRTVRNWPAVAYNRSRTHIWGLLGYDAASRRVHLRNPRYTGSTWMSLPGFRENFDLINYIIPGQPVPGRA